MLLSGVIGKPSNTQHTFCIMCSGGDAFGNGKERQSEMIGTTGSTRWVLAFNVGPARMVNIGEKVGVLKGAKLRACLVTTHRTRSCSSEALNKGEKKPS